MRLVSIPALVAMLAASAAQAEPATPEGAKALAATYAAYVSQAALDKGVVTVKPEGEDYVVSWSLEKLLAAIDAPAGVVKAAPLVYRVTPTVNGGWLLRANALPSLSIGPTGEGGREGGTLAFDGFHFDGRYDSTAAEIFLGKLGLATLKADFKTKSGSDFEHVVISQSGSAGDFRIKPGADPDSVDVRSNQSATSAEQKVAMLGEGAAETPLSATRQGAATGASAAIGLRAKAMGDLWRFAVAHADKGQPTPEELKPMLAALLPLWREISGRVDLDDLAVSFPGGSLSFKSLAQDVRLTGLVNKASLAMTLAFRDAALEFEGAPDWVKKALPASLAMTLEAGVDGLDAAAKIALDDADFLKTGDLSEAAKEKIAELLKDGHPHVTLTHTKITTPLVQATFDGEAKFEDETPGGHARVTADSLDKVLETLAKLTESQPDAQQFLILATFVRGLAKNEGGRLVWDIDYEGPESVKINGQSFPPKKD